MASDPQSPNQSFFSNQDAGVSATSDSKEFKLNYAWVLTINSTGLDGIPKYFIEWSPNGTDWKPLEICPEILVDGDPIIVMDNYLPARWVRMRIEPNGNTTGTISDEISLKIVS